MSGGLQSPYAAWLPPLSTAEKDALRQSIEADGVLVPIEVDDQGNILDGHHRHAIARELGREAPTRVLKGLTEGQREAHVNSSNRARRNMSPDQKEALRKRDIEIAWKLNAEGLTQGQIATELKVAQPTIAGWLTSNIGTDKTSKYDSRVKLSGEDKAEVHERIVAGDAQAQVAADLGVSQQRVSQVHKAEKKRLEREADLERQNADSRKPEEFYALVDSLCPGEFKREIFGREPHKGWLPPLGNEPDKFEVVND